MKRESKSLTQLQKTPPHRPKYGEYCSLLDQKTYPAPITNSFLIQFNIDLSRFNLDY